MKKVFSGPSASIDFSRITLKNLPLRTFYFAQFALGTAC